MRVVLAMKFYDLHYVLPCFLHECIYTFPRVMVLFYALFLSSNADLVSEG